MALVIKDRVKETTTTTGTGTYTLAGAEVGFQAFSAIGDGNTTYYTVTNFGDWEVGIGTYTASGTTLARSVILSSSNGDAAVSWSSGEKSVFVTQPSSKASFLDASGNLNLSGGTVDGRDVAADGVTADNALPKAGGQMTGNITMSGSETVDGRDLSTDGTKLDYITVTQAVSLDQMEIDIAALANGMVYKGDWSSASGSFPGGGAAQTGWFYYVSGAGTVNGITFAIGDNIIATTDNASASTYSGNWSKHDQTDAVTSVAGLNGSITKSALLSALNVEDGADVTDTTNVRASGALMDSEVTNLAQVKAFSSADYATAAQGTLAANALPKSGGAMTGAVTTSSTFDGRDVSVDGTKLDGIETGATADQTGAQIKAAYEAQANAFTNAQFTKLGNIEALADVTDVTNVTAAGALMDSEVDADIKTLSLPANTTISTFGASLVDDLTSAAARTTLGLGTAATTATTAYATAAQGTLATNALPKSGGALTGSVTTSSTFDGRDVATDGAKLDNIEANATADQTAAQIKTSYESNANTNEFSDAEQTKLSGIEASADVTDTTNVTSAGALMDSEVTNLSQVKTFSSADYATSTQGTTADNALPKSGGALTGAVTTNSTFDGRDVSVDGSKLDGIETGATADQTAAQILTAIKTVDGAGSGLDADLLDGLSSASFATSAQGTLATNALPKAGGSLTGAVTTSSTFDGRDVSVDGAKLDGIAAGATNTVGNATHTGEVTGSGALTIASNVVDEANLKVSNAPTNGYMLTAQSGNTGGLTWAAAPTSTTTVGAVGTYALMRNISSTANFTPGSTKAGSSLRYSNTYQNGANYGSGSTSASGTWRIMGHSGIYNTSLAYGSAGTSVSVYVRIS